MDKAHKAPYKRKNTNDQHLEKDDVSLEIRAIHTYLYLLIFRCKICPLFKLLLYPPEVLGTMGKKLPIRMFIKILFILAKIKIK